MTTGETGVLAPRFLVLPDISSAGSGTNVPSGSIGCSGTGLWVWQSGWKMISGSFLIQP